MVCHAIPSTAPNTAPDPGSDTGSDTGSNPGSDPGSNTSHIATYSGVGDLFNATPHRSLHRA